MAKEPKPLFQPSIIFKNFNMVFSSTGIAYLSLLISMALLTYRFFIYWKEKKDVTSKFFIYFGICFTLFAFFKTITGLFFINNIQVLVASTVFASFIEGLAAAFVAYLIIYLKFPRFRPIIGFWVFFFLGLLATILTITLKPVSPSIEPTGAINWGFSFESPILFYYSLFRALIILITFIPLIFILFQQYLDTTDTLVKKRSFGLGLLLLVGIIIGFIDFLFIQIFHLDAISRDIAMIFLSTLLFVVIFLTQKPTSS